MATKSLSVVIAGDASGAQSAFKKVESDADGLAGKLSGLGSKISPGMAAAAGAVVAGVGLMVRGAWMAAEESAKIGRETERVIKTTGAAAWTSADQVADYAEELSNVTGVDDELIQSGENLLLTFTRIQNKVGEGNDVFDRATAAALDMSTVLGTDMSGAAIQVGKALNDPIKGLTALSRAGVSFTAQQKEQIRTLTEAGDVLGAQKIILQELEKEFGGAAAAAATPFDKLRVQLGNLQEDLGSALIPAVSAAATAVQGLVSGFSALPGPAQGAIVGIAAVGAAGAGVVTIVAKIADTFGPAFSAAKGALDTAALGAANFATKMGLGQDNALKLASGISGIGSVALPATAALTAAFVGFSIVQDINARKAQEQKKRADEFTAAIESQTGSLEENVNATIAQQFANEGVGQIIQNTTADVKLFGDSIVTASDRIKVLSDEADTGRLENFEAELRKGAEAGDALSTEMLRLKREGELSTTQLMELANQLDDTSDAYNDGRTAAELNKGMTDAMATSAQNAAAASQANAAAIRDASNALREATDPWFAAQQAQTRLATSQNAYNNAVEDFGDGSPEAVEAYRQLAQAGFDYEGRLLDLSAAQADGETSAEELNARLQALQAFGIDPTSEAARAAGWSFLGLAGAADEANARNVDIPTTTPGLDTAIGKLTNLKALLAQFGRVETNIRVGAAIGAEPFAAGGSVGDGWFTVGEQGPELGFKSGSSVEIFSNSASSQMLAGGGSSTTNVVINMPAGSNGDDVVEAIKRYERRNGTAWRN